MAEIGLKKAVVSLSDYFSGGGKSFSCPEAFYTPGFWVVIAVKAKMLGISQPNFHLPAQTYNYAEAMGLPGVLWGLDTYKNQRVNQGKNYSPLVHLDHPTTLDDATSLINSCIRGFAQSPGSSGIKLLCEIVGELHDNVWSHGEASGMTMAQIYGKQPGARTIKFAVADGGCGFLSEMKRAGFANEATSDKEAIDWCLQEGNSTKHADDEDPWSQTLPEDAISSPYGKISTSSSSNHHQGLGLYKLAKFIREYQGSMSLVTGNNLMTIDNCGRTKHENVPYWKGVAISCSLSEQNLNAQPRTPDTDSIRSLMNKLRE